MKTAVREEIGEEGYRSWIILKKVKGMIGITQAKLPFELTVE